MTKKELIKTMSQYADINVGQAENALGSLTGCIINKVLTNGESLTIPGLGTFKQKIIPAHTGRNPKTGEAIPVAEKTKLVFHMSTSLK